MMKTFKKVLAVALAVVVVAAADSVSAQRIGKGIGTGIGARLTGRANAANTMDQGEIVVDESAAEPAAPQAAAEQTAASAPIKKSDGSEFVIPADATIAQLLEQATKLMSTEIAFETEAESDAWVAKMLDTIGKIGDRILKLKPSDEEFVQAITLKGQALCYQASLDSSVLPKLAAYASALEKNQKVQSLEDGKQAALAFRGVYLQAKVAEIAEQNGAADDLLAVMKDVSAFIAEHPETSDMTVDLVFPVALVAENQKQPKLPAQVWAPIRKQLAASEAPEAQQALQLLEGTIRYSELEGKPFEWKGCTADGKKFDAKQVEGKVVVVDFWASWCSQCADIHSKLMELYNKYHDQGFEVVGYNLDGKLDDMNAYLKKNSLPWLIESDRATVDAKETSLAAYYGISEIPTMILIGGDGKVAALDVSMESLVATLENVFSKSAASAAASKTTGSSAKTTGTASKTTAATAKTTGTASKTTGTAAKTTGSSAKTTGTTVSPSRKSNAPTTISNRKK